jgi:hypothetical protein
MATKQVLACCTLLQHSLFSSQSGTKSAGLSPALALQSSFEFVPAELHITRIMFCFSNARRFVSFLFLSYPRICMEILDSFIIVCSLECLKSTEWKLCMFFDFSWHVPRTFNNQTSWQTMVSLRITRVLLSTKESTLTSKVSKRA